MIKAVTISLLFFFIMDAIGSICFLLVDRYWVQKEMEILFHMPELNGKLTTLQFSKAESAQLNWLTENKEFTYADVLYDVQSIRHHANGSMTIRCMIDQKEAAVYESISEILDLNQPLTADRHSFVLNFFKFLSTLALHHGASSSGQILLDQKANATYTDQYQFSISSSLFQPPDLHSICI